MKAVFVARSFQHFESALKEVAGVLATSVTPVRRHDSYPPALEHEGPAECALAVEVEYEPSLVAFEKLLEVFWRSHDPQVPGHSTSGPHDRLSSAVVYTNDEQRIRAIMAKIQLDRTGRYQRPVATAILPASDFSQAVLGRDEPRDVWRPLRLRESEPGSSESRAPGDDRTAH